MAEETIAGSIGTARIDVTVNTGTMEAGVEAAKRRVSGLGTEAEAQFNKASASGKRYADSLLRQAEMLGKTRAEQIAYNAQTRIGGELGDKIAAKALANQAAMAKGLDGTAKTARELAFATRGLPAQITDIFTSLASGQRPTMVLLQQGGQLKDMFGGIGPAAKALGSSLLGLINPFTVSAAAATALLVAWKQGSDEAVAYNKALISTGNYAGETASHLGELAQSISQSTDATQHAVADTLAQVAASGKFTGQQLDSVGRAAVAMSTLTGQATEETVRQFEEIGKKPVEAILKLNDAQHFLTQETYAQIKALEDQGRTQDAAALAMKTYSDSLEDRAREVVDNAGDMERAWDAVAGAAKRAWDHMLDVGRYDPGAAVQKLNDQIDQLKKGRFLANGIYQEGLSEQSPEIQALRRQISDIYSKVEGDTRKARADALAARLTQDRADSDREAAAYFTNAQKRAREYLRAENEFNERIARAVKAGDTKLAAQERQQKAAVLAGINDKFEDKGAAKQAKLWATPIVDTAGLAKLSKDYVSGIYKRLDADEKAMQQSAKNTVTLNQYKDAMDARIQTEREAAQLQIESIGLGQHQIEMRRKIVDIERESNRDLEKLNHDFADKAMQMTQADYDARLRVIKAKEAARVQLVMDTDRRITEAMGDASLGAKAALADFEYSAGNVAGQTYDAYSNLYSGLADASADFVTKGKGDFSDLADSFISDLARMELRILESQALQAIFGSFAGGSGAGEGAPVDSWQGYDWSSFKPNAKGGVYDSPSLSAYSGRIVDHPTLFAFAKGNGLMGEAGPEAIMPLRRGPDGKLGVAAAGAGGGDVQVEVNITNNGQAVQAQQTGTRRDGQKVIVDMVLDAVASDIATGGRTSKAMQQRYGLQRRGVPVGG